MKYNRILDMERFIRTHQSVTNEELLNHFNISIQTLRRDLKILEKKGVITKYYGGAIYNETSDTKLVVAPLLERESTNISAKQYIGKLAADQVEDGDVIFIDSGTTAYRMLPYMDHLKNVTVISHSLNVLNQVRLYPHITAICAGGTLMNDSGSFLVDTNFYPYNYTKAFISTVGISVNRRLTNTNLHEGYMKHHVIQHARRVYVMADNSKFGTIAFNHFADFDDIDVIITDKLPPEQYVKICETNHIQIMY